MIVKKAAPALLFLISTIGFCVYPNAAQDKEIETLVREVSADTQRGAIFGYTYFMKFSYNRRKKIGYGRRFTRLYEAVIPTRFSLRRVYRHPFVLIRDSEKNVTEEEILEMRRRLVEELERAESEAEKDSHYAAENADGGYWTINFSADGKALKIDVLKLLENAELSGLRRTEFEGRKIVTLDFRPKSQANIENALAYLNKIEGRIWIDEADRRIIRIEGYAPGKMKEFIDRKENERERESVLLFKQTRVREGFWFPERVLLDFTKAPEIFDTVMIEFAFTDYSRSGVEIRSSEIAAPVEAGLEENR